MKLKRSYSAHKKISKILQNKKKTITWNKKMLKNNRWSRKEIPESRYNKAIKSKNLQHMCLLNLLIRFIKV